MLSGEKITIHPILVFPNTFPPDYDDLTGGWHYCWLKLSMEEAEAKHGHKTKKPVLIGCQT